MRAARRLTATLAAATLLVLMTASPASAAPLPDAELVADVNGGGGSDPQHMTAYNGNLYFSADDGLGPKLTVSTGGAPGVFTVYALSSPHSFTVFNSRLYFAATTPAEGEELWVIDGTNPPAIVADLNPGPASSSPTTGLPSFQSPTFTEFNGSLYFTATNGFLGPEPFALSSAGVISLVADIRTGGPGSNAREYFEFNGWLYFNAFADVATDFELWRTNGVVTTIYADISPTGFGYPHNFASAGGALYFVANDGSGVPNNYELFTTNGVTPPVQLTSDLANTQGYQYFGVHNDTLYFSAGNAAIGQELGSTTGGAVPTFVDIYPGAASSSPQSFTTYNGELWFGADNGTDGYEFMHTNGVSAPVVGPQIRPGAPGGDNYYLGAHGTSLYAVATGNGSSYELWLTNGTNVAQASNIFPTGDAEPYGFAELNGYLYFAADSAATGVELWRVQISTLALAAPSATALPPMGAEAEAISVLAGALLLAGGVLLLTRRRLA